MPVQPAAGFDFKIPPKPQGHVLDSAHFLQPEIVQRLESALMQDSDGHRVDVYILTVPSIQKGAFEAFTRQVAVEWMKGLFGAVVVFDDGTGNVAVQPTEMVTKRFYEFELSALMKDTMSSKKRPRLSRDGLEHTAMSVKEALHELKMRADKEDRKSLVTQVVLGIVVLLAAVLGAFAYVRNRPAEETALPTGGTGTE